MLRHLAQLSCLSARGQASTIRVAAHPPLYSAPTVTAANAGGNKYNVTITPVATTPLISYPLGGWVYYYITTAAGLPPTNQGFTCL